MKANMLLCTPDATHVCLLGDRYRVAVSVGGTPRPAVEVTDSAGAFRFFNPDVPDVVVKVLDGTAINDHVWVFYGSATDVDFQVDVTEMGSGEVKTYSSPAPHCGEADTDAFFIDPNGS